MATSVQMKHKQSGILKDGYYGFSWTSFFFGGFPALLRGDIAYGLGVLTAGLLFGAFSYGLLWFVVGLVWAFIYNKNYTHRLLERGYEFNDTPERIADAKRALGVDGWPGAMEEKPAKSPVLAGILSGLIPGLGQFYCLQWKKGVGFLIGALVADVALGASEGFFHLLQQLLAGSPPQDAGSILLRSLPLLAIAAWSVMDAVRSAQKSH